MGSLRAPHFAWVDPYDATMDVITSRSNPRVKEIRTLRTPKGRHRSGRTIVEGPTLCDELRLAGIPVSVVLTVDPIADGVTDAAGEVMLVTEDVLASVADTETPRSPIAVIDIPRPRPLRAHRTVVLVDIADPGNVGTMIRTARAFDWDVAIAGTTADPWAPKSLRSSAGSTFSVRPPRLDDPVGACRAIGLSTVALVVEDGAQPSPQADAVALMVGSEAHGLPPDLVAATDASWTIPMPGGTESLNAAVAAGIAMAFGVQG